MNDYYNRLKQRFAGYFILSIVIITIYLLFQLIAGGTFYD